MAHGNNNGTLLVFALVIIAAARIEVKNSRDEWELPGGRIDDGEGHSQTLSREFAEELSLDVAMGAEIDSYLFEVIPGRHVFIVTYGCTLVGDFRPAVSRAQRALSLAG